jgi:cysteine desulfurase
VPSDRIAYLDHVASTPMRPEARAAMVDVLDRLPGNPSGQHHEARAARRALDDARDVVADFVGSEPGDVVFTSGGTEADNLAVSGVARATGGRPLCLATDHHAVINPTLAAGGRTVGVDVSGVVDLDDLARALTESDAAAVALVSFALANNEVGTLQPVDDLVATVRRLAPDAAVHTDAVAAAAWTDLRASAVQADLLTLSGHKVGGPKGIGALVVRGGVEVEPLVRGGGQERERRPGTQDVAGAVAFAAALAATEADRAVRTSRTLGMRDTLIGALRAVDPAIEVTGAGGSRVANIVHVCVPGVERESLLFRLDEEGIAASAGSSCASGALERSHVLEAMGVSEHLAEGALRISLGWSTSDGEIERALAVIPAVIRDLRARQAGAAEAIRHVIEAGS